MENNKDGSSNSILLPLVVVLFILVISLGGYVFYDKIILKNDNEIQESKNNNSNSEENNTFSNVTKSGKVRVKGYITIEKMTQEGYYEAPTYDYAFFHILNTKSQDFEDYITGLKGNAFAYDNAIGLGCIENNQLSYVNESDQFGLKGFKLSVEDTNKLLNSSVNNPLTLDLERLEFTGGSGAPECYSHITHISILD